MRPQIGRIGLWAMELRFGDPAAIDEAAAELEELGYGALWIPGGIDDGVLGDFDRLLGKTSQITFASGIINIWKQQPEDVAAWWKGLSPDRQARVLLGIGVSHGPLIGETWGKPVAVTRDWIERALAAGLSSDALCVAALGPKMVALAGELTSGVHPYLVTPEHSKIARSILGPGKLIAQEQGAVLESDPGKARALARQALVHYTQLPNYVNNWHRLGFTAEDTATVSDRLVDGLFAWGDAAAIAARVDAHIAGGADHVCLQIVTGEGLDGSRKVWRELAKALL